MILNNISLKSFNTFGIDVSAKKFAEFATIDELKSIFSDNSDPFMILGGGSNVLFTKDFDGLILKNAIKGYEVVSAEGDDRYVKSGAGENWHSFVLKTIEEGFGGLENLSLIPGCVGASPMQNIGAYGREIKDVFHSLEAFHIKSGEVHSFSNEACKFGYRESVFKNELKGQYVILNVTFKLSTKHVLNTSYGAIDKQLEIMGISSPTIKDVSDAVVAIRSSKLPNPAEIGNAGSFFKNPVVEPYILEQIQKHYEDIPHYPAPNGCVKLAAGWLIEQAGWKGKTIANHGVHKNQALVLVNYGGSTGQQIFDLSTAILSDVYAKFGVQLEREVNIV